MLKALLLAMASILALASASRHMMCYKQKIGEPSPMTKAIYGINIDGPYIGDAACANLSTTLGPAGVDANLTWGCVPTLGNGTIALFITYEGCDEWIDQAFFDAIPDLQVDMQHDARCAGVYQEMRNATFVLGTITGGSSITLQISNDVTLCPARQADINSGIATVGDKMMRMAGWQRLLKPNALPVNGTMVELSWTNLKAPDLACAKSDLERAFPGYKITGAKFES